MVRKSLNSSESLLVNGLFFQRAVPNLLLVVYPASEHFYARALQTSHPEAIR